MEITPDRMGFDAHAVIIFKNHVIFTRIIRLSLVIGRQLCYNYFICSKYYDLTGGREYEQHRKDYMVRKGHSDP